MSAELLADIVLYTEKGDPKEKIVTSNFVEMKISEWSVSEWPPNL